LSQALESAAACEEAQLIRRIIEGQREQFHVLIRPYENSVFVIANSVLRNHADAEEAAQEAILKALQNLAQLHDHARFKAWLFQIAINEARLKLRSRKDRLYESLDETTDEGDNLKPKDFADWRELPSEALERSEIRKAISDAIEDLPEIYRSAFVLRDIEGLEVDDIAAVLGISNNVLHVRVHRARLLMREKLAPIFRYTWKDRLLSMKGKKPW
jgi:RNA polymerase sigma-70 factor (ECF subfamily)